MPNIDLIKKYNRIHMLGIGGVSMSGIAKILQNSCNTAHTYSANTYHMYVFIFF